MEKLTFKQAWELLGDIPVIHDEDSVLVIDDNYLDFQVGHDLHDIWYWLEETYNISLGKVMNGEQNGN